MKTQSEQTPKRSRHGRGYRRSVLVVAGTLAFALAAAGVVVAATIDRSSDREPDGSVVVIAPREVPTVVPPTTAPPAPESPTTESKPEPEPKPDPYALEDGVYPTFVRDVDIQRGEITVDVIQIFKHDEAVRAAVQDGMQRRDARYLFVYVRNENDLLRTVPVARDVKIHFMGVCEVPPNRHAALTELSDATTPYDEVFYYALNVVDGQIHRIGQHLAISAC